LAVSAPALPGEHHQLDKLSGGQTSLDECLRKRAHQSGQRPRSSVVTKGESRVAGYHALSPHTIAPTIMPGRFRQNMPNPITVVLLGRLGSRRAGKGGE